jgi:hypothetical protein
MNAVHRHPEERRIVHVVNLYGDGLLPRPQRRQEPATVLRQQQGEQELPPLCQHHQQAGPWSD